MRVTTALPVLSRRAAQSRAVTPVRPANAQPSIYGWRANPKREAAAEGYNHTKTPVSPSGTQALDIYV